MSEAPTDSRLDELCINTIRGLAMDAVEAAKSGHPGMPMGAAAIGYVLWTKHLRHNPRNPKWFNRDRFILSAGHGSMLLYSLLHLTGYDLPLEEIKRFRQFESMTPGHPENFMTPGVEVATGPLGQGCGMSVGVAIAERFLAATFNKPGHEIVDHRTYALCSDGDLMEGLSNEAASLAGHLGLSKLTWIYDDNRITIDGSTDLAFTEDVGARFQALGWQVLRADGLDPVAVQAALAQSDGAAGPTLIVARTTIGYGSPNKAGTNKSHGSPLGPEEVRLAKRELGIPEEPLFYIPEEALDHFRQAIPKGARLEERWDEVMAGYSGQYPEQAAAFRRALQGVPDDGWADVLPAFGPADKLATRVASGQVINAIADFVPTLIGGSADLAESNNTHIKSSADFQASTPAGRNINFGVREHAMVAAVNGITLHGGCRGYAASFLIFSDYCRPAIRLAALQRCPSIFVFTHDSIGLGEDGPTHQPVEHLMSLRAIPNLNVMRPADGNETAACWKAALESSETPTLIALTRQALPTVTPAFSRGVHPALSGAYVLADGFGAAQVIIAATGSEVHVALSARELLLEDGIGARVVSMPSWMLFEKQDAQYRAEVFPPGVPVVSVEAGCTLGWARYSQAHVGLDHFGSSAPGEVLFNAYGFTAQNVAQTARRIALSRGAVGAGASPVG